MIWLMQASLVVVIALLIVLLFYAKAILDELLEMPTKIPPIPDCRFKESESKCLYSPGSEPERICVLREEDKKNRDQKIPQVIPAPRWIDRNPPGE